MMMTEVNWKLRNSQKKFNRLIRRELTWTSCVEGGGKRIRYCLVCLWNSEFTSCTRHMPENILRDVSKEWKIVLVLRINWRLLQHPKFRDSTFFSHLMRHIATKWRFYNELKNILFQVIFFRKKFFCRLRSSHFHKYFNSSYLWLFTFIPWIFTLNANFDYE
jgi:hypothetical protein